MKHLEKEMLHCAVETNALKGAVSSIQNLTIAIHPSSLADASVQTLAVKHQAFEYDAQTHRQRLQSTMYPADTEEELMSPVPLDLHHDTKTVYHGKSPIKMQFPMYGRLEDTQDPLLFLEKCEDFLALHPLTDSELIATLRNVLHGTARDWWDVARLEINTWTEFEKRFSSSFLSEDYQDELAEWVRTRIQGEDESIRDFAYMYRSLCKRWNPTITEKEVVKLTLKNINPKLASQLRSSNVSTVEALVRLGQQLEKDRENQCQYEQHKKLVQKPTKSDYVSPLPPFNPPGVSQVYCWRCKNSHAPSACPQYQS